ncbi:IclR family transcriptional regulator [Paraburkholderia sp. SIMBA_055]|uniref:IclR family transcriptional regulator n=1 Tax=Paraburkholderia TaxID=1822464 RepID=UPI0006B3EFA5|nr:MULTISPECIES: IclR family transcriptional regulator [Paraburkholderia]ALE58132.1 IclR family transcriptional regulator [Burkholderia sp. HB1]AXF11898.1 IclR family transcriptional regulator [Paraburkholderia graminis]MDR6471047.1 DNA-binding IclR family transcriptional regulator [Paraburkholderia graminis]MDR6476573.1 DNA-binding IclR family transcriptional regulator [Paraburkholderia graminis]PTR03261.1 IclR family transcriptional regulator [Paraburkholderia sp. GV072]
MSKAAKAAPGKGASGTEIAEGGKTQRGIQSVEVGGRLLLALAQARMPLALSDLAIAADLAPGQAHAYLVSLSRLGLVKRDELSGRYEPGPLSLRLGLLHLENQPAFRAAVPRVAALAEAIGFSVAICIAGPQGPTIVRYEHGGFPLHVNLHVGTVMSLPATSTGRVFCAYLPRETLDAMWANQSGADQSATAAPRDAAFQTSLEKIRARGLESSVDAPSPGISSLSAPVFDPDGRLALALTVIGSTGSIDVAADGRIARALLGAAREIGAELAAQPSLLASSAS